MSRLYLPTISRRQNNVQQTQGTLPISGHQMNRFFSQVSPDYSDDDEDYSYNDGYNGQQQQQHPWNGYSQQQQQQQAEYDMDDTAAASDFGFIQNGRVPLARGALALNQDYEKCVFDLCQENGKCE